MKQPARTSPGKRPKRKSREELNQEARDRKRDKKHSGHSAGSRSNPAAQPQSGKGGNGQPKDPRIGSKKPIPLGADVPVATSSKKPAQPEAPAPRMSAKEELASLENNERLDQLLDRLEAGETLSGEEQAWLDETLDRIDELMEKLGIAIDDGADDEEAEEDMYRLLKGGQ